MIAEHPKPQLRSELLKTVDQSLIKFQKESSKATSLDQQVKVWPQIDVIVNKISTLEYTLSQQTRMNMGLKMQIKLLMEKLVEYQRDFQKSSIQVMVQKEGNLMLKAKIEELEEKLSQKDQCIVRIQMQQSKRIEEYQDKVNKMKVEQKLSNDKMKMSNADLQIQRRLNETLKRQMTTKIQKLQSDKEEYLKQEIKNLKKIVQSHQSEREKQLLRECSELKRELFNLDNQLRIAHIKFSLIQRKNINAVKQVINKKDQEIKVQKVLNKSLQEKIATLKEEQKIKIKKLNESLRPNRIINTGYSRGNEQEVYLDLSP